MSKQQATRLDRKEWVRSGLEALMEGGMAEVAVEKIARRLGVTKGSFYWHFSNRGELLEAMLNSWEQHGTIQIIEDVDAQTDDPRVRARALARRTFRITPFDRLEGALRTWAASDAAARRVVQRVDQKRLAYVRDLLIAAGIEPNKATRRAAFFYRALIGEFAYRSAGGQALEEGAIDDAVESLLS